MNKRTIPEWLFTLLALIAACAAAFILRVILPYASVFDGQWIKFIGADSYYYMRVADNLLHNFPILYGFDPYLVFPGGFFTGNFPAFFAYLLAATIKLLGGAAPTQQTIDTIAAYVPAALGILAVIPVYFIGRALINRWAGLVAAMLTAIMPGELLYRSLLGYTDHHVNEVLLTACFAVFFILAVKQGRQFTYAALTKEQFPSATRSIQYSLLAGVSLGMYLITWTGALLFVFIVFIYFIIQFISDHLRGFPTDYLSKIAITCFLISLLIFLPVSRDKLTLLSLATIILAPIALNMASAIMSARDVKPLYYLVVVATLAGLGALAAWLIFPSFFQVAAYYISGIFAWRTEQNVVGEMKSLFFPGGTFTTEVAWSQFALVLYTGLAGLAALICRAIRKGEPEVIFVSVWSIIMMFAAFAMVRFTAYLSICLALATGYLAAYAVTAFASGGNQAVQARPPKKARKSQPPARAPLRLTIAATVASIVLIAVIIPGTSTAVAVARNPGHTPSNAWMEALEWMKKNTPEPFGNADFYYSLYNTPAPGKGYAYPATAYGIVVWSDYGYWVTRIGHRMPTSNPGSYGIGAGGYSVAEKVAKYFTAQDESTTLDSLKEWQAGYVVIDSRIVSPNDKFYALANLSGLKETDFYELCWQKKNGKYEPLLVFYPQFYQSIACRLYNFDGKQVTPQNTLVMAYKEQVMPDGRKFKEITSVKSFKSYDDARSFISTQKGEGYAIIGADPLSSPVPLPELHGYKPVYQSTQQSPAGSAPMPEIKIFEYTEK